MAEHIDDIVETATLVAQQQFLVPLIAETNTNYPTIRRGTGYIFGNYTAQPQQESVTWKEDLRQFACDCLQYD